MALIELNLEKPAFKRVESTETTDEGSETGGRESGPEESKTIDISDEEESGGGVGRKTAMLGTLAIGVLGLVTFRKLRNRRRSES